MLRADPHKLASQRHQRAGDGVWSLSALGQVLLDRAGGQETRVAVTRSLFFRMASDSQSISPCPRYQPQPPSRTQRGLAAPCAAQHPCGAHPPGPGVQETPSALGTADNPSAPTGAPLIIT